MTSNSKPENSSTTLPKATMSERDGVRYLHLGNPTVPDADAGGYSHLGGDLRWIQGSMLLSDPLALQGEYLENMMVWMLLRDPGVLSSGLAVQLGLGAGSIARFTHGVLQMKTLVVELNETVIDLCTKSFNLPQHSRLLEVRQMDAAAFVADPLNKGIAQVLIVDLYDEHCAAPVLDSEEFYRGCRQTLAVGGVMTMNLFGKAANFEKTAERIASVFGYEQIFYMLPTAQGNTILVAMNWLDFPAPDKIFERADNLEHRFKLPANKWLTRMKLVKSPPPPARFS